MKLQMGFQMDFDSFLKELVANESVKSTLQVGFNELWPIDPSHHIILEQNPILAEKAILFVKDRPYVKVLQESWNTHLPKLEEFDLILISGEESLETQDVEKASRILSEGKTLAKNIETNYPNLKEVQYSDADIEAFYAQVPPFFQEQLPSFFEEIKKNGQITEAQMATILKRHPEKEKPKTMIDLLEAYSTHMPKNARLVAFQTGAKTQYENPSFFEKILTNPTLIYTEKYFPKENILLFWIEKK